jgi:Mrp family chromosome partitioning ATPase/capsular polysaccharide biosynthesis protein
VTGYLGMDVPRFLGLVSARRRMVAVMAIGAAALALLASATQTKQYEAGADLWFGAPSSAESIVPAGTDPVSRPERVAATNLALASLDTVAARVKQRFGAKTTLDELRHAVSVEPQGESDVVTVTARSDSPVQAARVANAFATEIVALRRDDARDEVQRAIDAVGAALAGTGSRGRRADARTLALQSRLSDLEVVKALQSGSVQLVQRATPPQHATSPRPVRNAALAAFVALAVGLLLIIGLTRSGDAIPDEEALAAIVGAPILARIPAAGRARRSLSTSSAEQDAGFLEAFEFLRLNLEVIGREEEGALVVAITSPTAAEGKTTVTARLARSIAQDHGAVVTLDMDLSRPALRSYLREMDSPDGPDARNGGAAGGGDHAAARENEALRSLTARDHLGVRPGLISRRRMEQLFEDLREDADFVLVDTGPVSVAADTTAVVAAADGVVLVIDARRIRRRDLLAARRQLDKARARVIGIVINRDPDHRQAAAGRPGQSPIARILRAAPVGRGAPGTATERPNS